jgi:phosphopantetheinyl transferase
MNAGDLDVWCWRMPRAPASPFARSDAWLDDAEHERLERFTDSAARERYRTAHQFLRWVLAAYVGGPEAEVHIRRDPGGRPRLAASGRGAWEFSLSHARDLVAVAVARGVAVGVDVESTRSLTQVGWSQVFGLDAAFEGAELAAIRAMPLSTARPEIVRLWTLKEALAKAVGKGIALPLRVAAFPLLTAAGAAGAALRTEAMLPDKQWWFVCSPLDREEWLSAAIGAGEGRTRLLTVADAPARLARESVAAIRYARRDQAGIPQPDGSI